MRGIFEPFDDPVGRFSGDSQAATDTPNGLMMRRIHVELLLAENAGQTRSFFDQYIVTMAIARLAGVLDVGPQLGIDVLNERAAGGNIHHLHAETDAEGRDASLACDTGEGE